MGAGKAQSSKGKSRLVSFFLTEPDPICRRRSIKTRRALIASATVLIIFVVLMGYFGGREQTSSPAAPQVASVSTTAGAVPSTSSSSVRNYGTSGPATNAGHFDGSSISTPHGSYSVAAGSRQHSAAQVIRRGAGSGDPGSALPLGSTITARLVNSILSTDTASPVIAEIPVDVISHNFMAIPRGTRAIGSVRFDEQSRRLQLKFQTLVYPEGDQHPIQAIGMMPDGSAGLDGDYNSGAGSREAGRFLGHFIGAMADGMKNRQAGGPFGIPYEEGSLKNGILSGVALTAEDEAKSTTEALNGVKATMSLSAGQSFLLFFEREYNP